MKPKFLYLKRFSLIVLCVILDAVMWGICGQRFFQFSRMAFVLSVITRQSLMVVLWAGWLAAVMALLMTGSLQGEIALLLCVGSGLALIMDHTWRTPWVSMVLGAGAMFVLMLGGNLVAGEFLQIGWWTAARLLANLGMTCLIIRYVV